MPSGVTHAGRLGPLGPRGERAAPLWGGRRSILSCESLTLRTESLVNSCQIALWDDTLGDLDDTFGRWTELAQRSFGSTCGANLRRPSSDAVGCAVRALAALPGAENLLHCSMSITVDKGTPQAQVYKNIVMGKLFCVAVPGVGNGRHSVKLNQNESLRAMQRRVQKKIDELRKVRWRLCRPPNTSALPA
jgi:hypothetical protein